jgi:predicted Zn-dependent peptidase
VKGKELLKAVTPEQLQAVAKRYLTPDGAVEIDVLPEGVDDPMAAAATAAK